MRHKATGRGFVQIPTDPDKKWLCTDNSHCIPKNTNSAGKLFRGHFIRQRTNLNVVSASTITGHD